MNFPNKERSRSPLHNASILDCRLMGVGVRDTTIATLAQLPPSQWRDLVEAVQAARSRADAVATSTSASAAAAAPTSTTASPSRLAPDSSSSPSWPFRNLSSSSRANQGMLEKQPIPIRTKAAAAATAASAPNPIETLHAYHRRQVAQLSELEATLVSRTLSASRTSLTQPNRNCNSTRRSVVLAAATMNMNVTTTQQQQQQQVHRGSSTTTTAAPLTGFHSLFSPIKSLVKTESGADRGDAAVFIATTFQTGTMPESLPPPPPSPYIVDPSRVFKQEPDDEYYYSMGYRHSQSAVVNFGMQSHEQKSTETNDSNSRQQAFEAVNEKEDGVDESTMKPPAVTVHVLRMGAPTNTRATVDNATFVSTTGPPNEAEVGLTTMTAVAAAQHPTLRSSNTQLDHGYSQSLSSLPQPPMSEAATECNESRKRGALDELGSIPKMPRSTLDRSIIGDSGSDRSTTGTSSNRSCSSSSHSPSPSPPLEQDEMDVKQHEVDPTAVELFHRNPHAYLGRDADDELDVEVCNKRALDGGGGSSYDNESNNADGGKPRALQHGRHKILLPPHGGPRQQNQVPSMSQLHNDLGLAPIDSFCPQTPTPFAVALTAHMAATNGNRSVALFARPNNDLGTNAAAVAAGAAPTYCLAIPPVAATTTTTTAPLSPNNASSFRPAFGAPAFVSHSLSPVVLRRDPSPATVATGRSFHNGDEDLDDHLRLETNTCYETNSGDVDWNDEEEAALAMLEDVDSVDSDTAFSHGGQEQDDWGLPDDEDGCEVNASAADDSAIASALQPLPPPELHQEPEQQWQLHELGLDDNRHGRDLLDLCRASPYASYTPMQAKERFNELVAKANGKGVTPFTFGGGGFMARKTERGPKKQLIVSVYFYGEKQQAAYAAFAYMGERWPEPNTKNHFTNQKFKPNEFRQKTWADVTVLYMLQLRCVET